MLYWILIAYLIVAYFVPEVGIIALICMIGPVAMAFWKGRYWCGNICPRGSFYDKVVSRISPHKPIPKFVRSKGFRIFMLVFIFAMFGVQLYINGLTLAGIGRTFWTMILVTTIVGVVLGVIYAPRTWCSFCPMGTLSAWASPRKPRKGFPNIYVASTCQMKCKRCAKVCPMQLTPYDARGDEGGYMDPDCIKCGRCVAGCPISIMMRKKR